MNALERKSKELPFLEKLILVAEQGIFELWENRKNLPNLSKDEFKQILHRIDRIMRLRWIIRKSTDGPHGKTRDDKCFKFNCEIQFGGIFEIETKFYFIKGYFFDKEDLKGITIQSFREE